MKKSQGRGNWTSRKIQKGGNGSSKHATSTTSRTSLDYPGVNRKGKTWWAREKEEAPIAKVVPAIKKKTGRRRLGKHCKDLRREGPPPVSQPACGRGEETRKKVKNNMWEKAKRGGQNLDN